MFYVLAAGIQLLEIPGDLLPQKFIEKWEPLNSLNFVNACYFVIVTLSTVGYGDISPQTIQGRIYTLFIIIVGIVVFTTVISELVEQASRRRGSGSFVKNNHTRHVIVTGTPTMTDLVHFVSEFYSDSRMSNVNAKVVVMVEEPQWTDGEWFQYIARNQFLQARLRFLCGSVRNSADLQRAKLSSADAVFILTSPSTGEEPSIQDTRTVMNILAVRNVRTDISIYAQTLLEDSSLQTDVALSTASSFAKGDMYCRRRYMDQNSEYNGLFRKVLEAEFRMIPKVHREKGRQCFEDIFNHHKALDSSTVELEFPIEADSKDLRRSQHVCLQEIHMALIAGNIKANGVGTLLSNMYLDVQTTKLSKEEPAWLFEYHMGAACSLAYAIIPEQLNGVPIKEIALDLFHIGVIIIATSDPNDIKPTPVLATDMILRYGDLALLLTYHDYQYVGAALHIIGLRYAHGELRHMLTSGSSSADPLSQSFYGNGSTLPGLGNLSMSADTLFQEDSTHGGNKMVHSTGNLNVRFSSQRRPFHSASADDLDALADMTLGDQQRGLVASRTSDAISAMNSTEYIPNDLKDHVILAMEGDAPLGSIPLLLRNLWRRSNRRSLRGQRRARVVVIHPSISEDVRQKFSRFERVSLFFVEGSPASRASWRKARLNTAKSVATIADYTKPWALSDARTIFTLLTLDISTTSDHDLFICSELVDEKSLEFLREPSHARRRGASLGEVGEGMFSPDGSKHIERREGGSSDDEDEITYQDPDEEEGENAQIRGQASATSSGLQTKATVSKRLRQSLSILPLGRGTGSIRSDAKSFLKSQPLEAVKDEAPENLEADPAAKPGAARARRGTLFSRSRYASGELLVHSSAITLLVREYIEPGFVQFFTSILGTEAAFPGMRIRLVKIPTAMFDPKQGYCCKEGRRLIRYNIIFKMLVRIGVTPLGIYRSGVAPILVPSRSRRKRGVALFDAVNELMEKHGEQEEEEVKDAVGNGFFEGIYGLVKEVVPSQMKEAQGRQEVQGNLTSSSNGSSDGEDDTHDDDEVLQNQESKESRNRRRTPGTATGDASQPRKGTLFPKYRGEETKDFQRQTSIPRQSSIPSWLPSPRKGRMSKAFEEREDSLEVPGQVRYTERMEAENLLPYVFTLPDPNTWCSETDGIYILCHPSLDLPRRWCETSSELD